MEQVATKAEWVKQTELLIWNHFEMHKSYRVTRDAANLVGMI